MREASQQIVQLRWLVGIIGVVFLVVGGAFLLVSKNSKNRSILNGMHEDAKSLMVDKVDSPLLQKQLSYVHTYSQRAECVLACGYQDEWRQRAVESDRRYYERYWSGASGVQTSKVDIEAMSAEFIQWIRHHASS